jgi:DNA-binding response OmpR family regulator
MTSKRILFIHDDRLLLRFYHDKLEENGFVVETARELEQGEKILAEHIPDVILLDHVFLAGNACDFIKALRAKTATAQLPVLIFPSALMQLADECVAAGATSLIRGGGNPVVSILNEIRTTLGMPGLGDVANVALFKPEDFWIKSILANSVESINQMRHCLPGISERPPELSALHNLWNLAHAFAEKAALLPSKPFAQLARALDLLLHELNEMPDQLNPSTIRTVGQALDFLAAVNKADCMERLTDPAIARLLVVDDEESARRFITSALELVGLSSDCADSPSCATEKLEGKKADLIFLDVGLPEMNGFELCSKIRALEEHKTTPIVFLTGMATFQNKARASLSGGNDFVGKPFNLPELGLKALIWLYRGQLAML